MKPNIPEDELFEKFSNVVRDLPKLEANPYLKTRLLANLESPARPSDAISLKKPVVVIWLVLLLINLVSFAWWGNSSYNSKWVTGDDTSTLVEEYALDFSGYETWISE
ncbi:MAG: hypothetical protein Kow0037_31310 [Calditrichia bacterium]